MVRVNYENPYFFHDFFNKGFHNLYEINLNGVDNIINDTPIKYRSDKGSGVYITKNTRFDKDLADKINHAIRTFKLHNAVIQMNNDLILNLIVYDFFMKYTSDVEVMEVLKELAMEYDKRSNI